MRQSCHRLLEHQHPGGEEPPLYSPIDQISGNIIVTHITHTAKVLEQAKSYTYNENANCIGEINKITNKNIIIFDMSVTNAAT